MTWEEICQQYSYKILIVEAINAFTKGTHRIVKELNGTAVFDDYDWQPAWKEYERLHHADLNREYPVLHSNRQQMNIRMMDWFGLTFKDYERIGLMDKWGLYLLL